MAESIYNQFHRRTFVNGRKFYLYIAQDLHIFDTRKQLGKSYYSYNGKWDTVWDGDNKTLLKSLDVSSYQPWRQVARGKYTCTANITIAQDVQLENHSAPIEREDIATALHKHNVLRQIESIQISPNGRFCSIKFQFYKSCKPSALKD